MNDASDEDEIEEASNLQAQSTSEDVIQDDEEDEEGFSLEELGAAYKHATGIQDEVLQREHLEAAQQAELAELAQQAESAESSREADDLDEELGDELGLDSQPEEVVASPQAIIEAAMFVGHPESQSMTSARLASIMRDVTPEEVEQLIADLNDSYKREGQGIRIAQDEMGYKMVIAPEVESVRMAFTGKVRETQLGQPAIEVLSLVAYQPGITAAECTDRRGRDSGSLLNQMVRRRLVEVRREPIEQDESSGKRTKPKMVSRFYPAERLLVLLGLDSIEDLPQVEEMHLT